MAALQWCGEQRTSVEKYFNQEFRLKLVFSVSLILQWLGSSCLCQILQTIHKIGWIDLGKMPKGWQWISKKKVQKWNFLRRFSSRMSTCSDPDRGDTDDEVSQRSYSNASSPSASLQAPPNYVSELAIYMISSTLLCELHMAVRW